MFFEKGCYFFFHIPLCLRRLMNDRDVRDYRHHPKLGQTFILIDLCSLQTANIHCKLVTIQLHPIFAHLELLE